LNQTVSFPAPSISGGPVTNYSISPTNITEVTGLTFDTATGVLSGTVSKACTGTVVITATNRIASSEVEVQLKVGTSLSYSNGTSNQSTINGMVGVSISKYTASIVNGIPGVAVSEPYRITGNLFGLDFNATTGVIDGTPKTTGTGTVDVTATFSDSSSSTVTLNISISQNNPSVARASSFPNKTLFLAGGASLLGLGVVTGAVAYYKMNHPTEKPSTEMLQENLQAEKPPTEKPPTEMPPTEMPPTEKPPTEMLQAQAQFA
jgi:hypothetical protein